MKSRKKGGLKNKNKKIFGRINLVRKLAKKRTPTANQQIVQALSDSNPEVRSEPAKCLGQNREKSAVKFLLDSLGDYFPEVRMNAAESLGIILSHAKNGKSPRPLIERLRDSNELVRVETADSLGAIGDQGALPGLWKATRDKSSLVRSYASSSIGEMGRESDKRKLWSLLSKERSPRAKLGILEGLFSLGERRALFDILVFLKSKDYRIRCSVVNIVSGFHLSSKEKPLVLKTFSSHLKNEKSEAVRTTIRRAVKGSF